MDPNDLKEYTGQIGEMRFANGERVRAHILSVDPDVFENHVFYDLLEVVQVVEHQHQKIRHNAPPGSEERQHVRGAA